MHLWPKLGNRSTARHGRAVKNHQNYMVHQSPTLERGDRPAMGFCLAHNFLKDLQAFVCFYFISTYFDKRSFGMRAKMLVARSKTSPQEHLFQKKINLMKRNDHSIIIKSIPIIYFHFWPIFAEFKSFQRVFVAPIFAISNLTSHL